MKAGEVRFQQLLNGKMQYRVPLFQRTYSWEVESNPAKEIASLYDKLEYVILPMYHTRPIEFAKVRRSAIALDGSFYNAQRMVFQYVENAYVAEEECVSNAVEKGSCSI
jgi:hypothetical protein